MVFLSKDRRLELALLVERARELRIGCAALLVNVHVQSEVELEKLKATTKQSLAERFELQWSEPERTLLACAALPSAEALTTKDVFLRLLEELEADRAGQVPPAPVDVQAIIHAFADRVRHFEDQRIIASRDADAEKNRKLAVIEQASAAQKADLYRIRVQTVDEARRVFENKLSGMKKQLAERQASILWKKHEGQASQARQCETSLRSNSARRESLLANAKILLRTIEQFRNKLDELESRLRSSKPTFEHYKSKVEDLVRRLRAAAPQLAPYHRPWSDVNWQPFTPPTAPPRNGCLRVGYRDLSDGREHLPVPVLIPFLGESHLWLEFPDRELGHAIDYSISLVLRVIAAFPPGKLHLLIYDPVDLGWHFRIFTSLLPEAYCTFCHQQGKIEEYFKTLIDTAATRNRLFTQEYNSVFEMNADLERVAVPHTLIVLKDFPHGIEARAQEHLNVITTNGYLYGIHILGLISPRGKTLRQDKEPDPTMSGTILQLSENNLYIT
jgi:hypothetical protein